MFYTAIKPEAPYISGLKAGVLRRGWIIPACRDLVVGFSLLGLVPPTESKMPWVQDARTGRASERPWSELREGGLFR